MTSVTRIDVLQTEARHGFAEPVETYLSGLAPGSRRAMRQVLGVIARELGGDMATVRWHLLEYKDTQAVRARLMARYAPATANRALSALRGLLLEAFRLGWMDADSYQRAADLRPVRGTRVLRGRALSPSEVAALYSACEVGTVQGARDAAALALCFGAGLRRAEAVAVQVADYDVASSSIVILGKGNRQRRVFLGTHIVAPVSTWISARGSSPGPLLLGVNKADRVEHRQLSPEAIAVLLMRLARRAGIAAVTPHDLRRTFVSELLRQGVDLATVQALAGHASPKTTVRYDRRGEDVQRRAVELLKLATSVR